MRPQRHYLALKMNLSLMKLLILSNVMLKEMSYLSFKGGELIEKHKPIILLELLRKWSARFNYHPNEVIELLRDHGYNSYVCAPDSKLSPIQLITEETIETNFFFVHAESRLREKLTFS